MTIKKPKDWDHQNDPTVVGILIVLSWLAVFLFGLKLGEDETRAEMEIDHVIERRATEASLDRLREYCQKNLINLNRSSTDGPN